MMRKFWNPFATVKRFDQKLEQKFVPAFLPLPRTYNVSAFLLHFRFESRTVHFKMRRPTRPLRIRLQECWIHMSL